jgi:hypothetical protein
VIGNVFATGGILDGAGAVRSQIEQTLMMKTVMEKKTI